MAETDGPPGSGPVIDYAALVREALVEMVHKVLARAAEQGLPGDHHFYLTFDTSHDGVQLSPSLRRQFPQQMTIVLQHQFWNLQVDAQGFAVTLRFGGAPERVSVPWPALLRFADPAASFGVELRPAGGADEHDAETGDREASTRDSGATGQILPMRIKEEADARPAPVDDAAAAKVVELDAFRRRPNG